MDVSDEEVQLGANQKKKEKNVGAGNIFKKNRTRILPDLLQEMRVNDRESYFRLFV